MTKSLPYKLFRELRIPVGANEVFFAKASDYVPVEGQVLIVSYPKCGTTWLQHIVYLLLSDERAANSMSKVISTIPFPEQDGFPPDVRTEDIRALKFHLPFSMMRYTEDARYIHIARNPKDACVSYYYFLKKLPGYHIDNFNDFLEAFIDGELPYGDYVEMVSSWFEKRHLPNVLFMTYESLTRNRTESVLNIASFLDFVDLDEEIIKGVLKHSSFDFMKALAEEDPFMQQYLKDSTRQVSEEDAEPQMLRKGIVGDWRNYFDRGQSELVDNYLMATAAGVALMELWSDDMQY